MTCRCPWKHRPERPSSACSLSRRVGCCFFFHLGLEQHHLSSLRREFYRNPSFGVSPHLSRPFCHFAMFIIFCCAYQHPVLRTRTAAVRAAVEIQELSCPWTDARRTGGATFRPDGACDPPACRGLVPLTDRNPTPSGGQSHPFHPGSATSCQSKVETFDDSTEEAWTPKQAKSRGHHEIDNHHEGRDMPFSLSRHPESNGSACMTLFESRQCCLVLLTEGLKMARWRNHQTGCGLTPSVDACR
ncbi:hypothetical protein N657DRAFT_9073 [Parathielavia appendiculata]|uniref:Uncharacterized protein n=1 Tax=Parathielavia appendiculata TaxID=2587402 RepID=A0AAN6U853_9PEZI|nr:hypothetical protein N657DRAFT_9073 [Parathielavia appendiculata]